VTYHGRCAIQGYYVRVEHRPDVLLFLETGRIFIQDVKSNTWCNWFLLRKDYLTTLRSIKSLLWAMYDFATFYALSQGWFLVYNNYHRVLYRRIGVVNRPAIYLCRGIWSHVVIFKTRLTLTIRVTAYGLFVLFIYERVKNTVSQTARLRTQNSLKLIHYILSAAESLKAIELIWHPGSCKVISEVCQA
jgi:hypothetical protein